MTEEKLHELADRVAGLSGACRQTDCLIAEALGWKPIPNPMHAGGLVGRWHRPDGTMSGHDGPPYWTASLDAAMTLYITLPERVPSDPRKAAAEALRQRAEVFNAKEVSRG